MKKYFGACKEIRSVIRRLSEFSRDRLDDTQQDPLQFGVYLRDAGSGVRGANHFSPALLGSAGRVPA